jgi:hypothetical protein
MNEVQTYEWMNECHINFSSSYKFVCQMCFQCMILMCEMYKLWLNFFCTTSITKSWDTKFVMYVRWKINGNLKNLIKSIEKRSKKLVA